MARRTQDPRQVMQRTRLDSLSSAPPSERPIGEKQPARSAEGVDRARIRRGIDEAGDHIGDPERSRRTLGQGTRAFCRSVGRSVGRSVVRGAPGGQRIEDLLERGQKNGLLDEFDRPELHRRNRRRYVTVPGQHSDRRVDSRSTDSPQ
ncbi:MAG: hypothetical protein AB7L71_17075, partial [Vicinamibacterales bacterium]